MIRFGIGVYLKLWFFIQLCCIEAKESESVINFDGLRLPRNIEPRNYDFTIKAYLPGYDTVIEKHKEFTFDATIRITLNSKKPTNIIILNAMKFIYHKEKSYVLTKEKRRINIDSIRVDLESEKVAFVVESNISEGYSELIVEYSGDITTKTEGIYRNFYQDEKREEKIGAITQFEMIEARRMVPCFDEPIFKSRWTVTVIHPRGTTALSNQIETGEPKVKGDFLITKFKPTVPMSSYILALSISDFKYIEGFTSRGLRMRLWLPPLNITKADFALKAGLKCIEGMEKLYGSQYPMEKIDMIGVRPFSHGAMENYGLIVYAEKYLMYEEGNAYKDKLFAASIISHELVHMWFGNQVTMEWWDNAWLNEGFASYYEIAGRNIIFDGYLDAEDVYIAETQNKVFNSHNEEEAYPLIQERNSTITQFSDQFAYIYMKGGSVLAMFRRILGKTEFDGAIKKYLAENRFGIVDHNTLLHYLQDVVPADLKGPQGETPLNFGKFAERWLRQPGFPILSVTELNETAVRITQRNPFRFKWDVPLWIQEKNHKYLSWLPFDQNVVISRKKQNHLVLNYDSNAVVRVNYTERGWKKIIKQLRKDHTVYSDLTKHRLLMDIFDLSNQSPQELVNALTPYLIKEKAYLPWYAMANSLHKSVKVVLPKELVNVLHKEKVIITDDASYMANRAKDQQREIYCRFVDKCKHKRHGAVSADMLMNHH